MPRCSCFIGSQQTRIVLLLAAVMGNTVACAVPNPFSSNNHSNNLPTVQELVLKVSSMTVNRLTEPEVTISFTPPEGMHISNLRYRLDQGIWHEQKDVNSAWSVKTASLSLGDHIVEMRATVNGERPLSGVLYLKVIEDGNQETSWGGANTSWVTIVI